jgi:hypothetical protein
VRTPVFRVGELLTCVMESAGKLTTLTNKVPLAAPVVLKTRLALHVLHAARFAYVLTRSFLVPPVYVERAVPLDVTLEPVNWRPRSCRSRSRLRRRTSNRPIGCTWRVVGCAGPVVIGRRGRVGARQRCHWRVHGPGARESNWIHVAGSLLVNTERQTGTICRQRGRYGCCVQGSRNRPRELAGLQSG